LQPRLSAKPRVWAAAAAEARQAHAVGEQMTAGSIRRCAVVGSPIAHSRSPVLHRAAYRALGLTTWSYDRAELTGAELAGWLASRDESWRGLSVTMPLKQAALASADTATELAAALGAANTLVRTEDGWHADNSDVAGLLGALADVEPGAMPRADSATVVGAGGTAAAAVAALSALGHKRVDIMARDPLRASPLLAVADRLGLTARVHAWPGSSTQGSPLEADLVISTVPSAATRDLLGHRWRTGQTVVDVTYDPWPTTLCQAAAAGGAVAIGGASVLLWQAVRQVELMTGRRAPVEAMRDALLPGGNLAPG